MLISDDQFFKGIHRILDTIPELSLDVPDAHAMLKNVFEQLAVPPSLHTALLDFGTPAPLHYYKEAIGTAIREFFDSCDFEVFKE